MANSGSQSSQSTVAPRLVRAVSEATQPFGAFLQGPPLHVLEEYLADPTEAQLVYQTLLQRASAEPISLSVVARCVEVLKRYLPRYAASLDILQQIFQFCQLTAQNLGNSQSGLQKSVLYLQTLSVNLLHLKQGSTISARHARGISEPALLVKRGSSSSLGRDEFKRTASVPEGAEPITLRAASSARQSSFAETSLPPSTPYANDEPEVVEGRAREEGEMTCNLLRARWGDAGEGMSDSAARLLTRYKLSVAREEDDGCQPVASHAYAVQREIDIIRRVQRHHIQRASHPGPESLRPKLRDNRPRLLFQHRPYSEQERLNLSEAEIGAVVEAVLGVADGARLWGDRDMLEAREASGRAPQQSQQPGRVCANILIKLLLDLWSANEAATSFPLALMLLTGGLESERPAVRARSFDVIFNLAVHAELLYPSRTTTIDIEAEATEAAERNPGEPLAPLGTLPSVGPTDADGLGVGSPFQEPSGDSQAVSDINKLRFLSWLRLLLFQLMLHIVEREERSEEVWLAALGALLHLTVVDGRPHRPYLQPLSPLVLSSLLRCCAVYHWSEQVQCHLIRMAANLLYGHPRGTSDSVSPDIPEEIPSQDLVDSRLLEFGGIEEVVLHFKQALFQEARNNLFAILLDWATLKIKADREAGLQPEQQLVLKDALHRASSILAAGGTVEAIQAAFRCAWPGFAAEFTQAFAFALDSKDGALELEAIQAFMEAFEVLACDCAKISPPADVLPAVQDTLASVQGDDGDREGDSTSEAAWKQLAEFLCSDHDEAASLGSSWLLTLLISLAESHLGSGMHSNVVGFGNVSVALLPQLPGALPSPKGPRGISNQPHLTAVLRHVLSQPSQDQNLASRVVEVVRRLLLYIRIKCSRGDMPGSPHVLDDGRPAFMNSRAGSLELGLIGGGGSSPAMQKEPFLLSSDGMVTPPLGPGSGAGGSQGRLSGGMSDSEGINDVWASASPSSLMLPTLFLAMEWLYDAPEDCIGLACFEAATLLLDTVTCMAAPHSQTKQQFPPYGAQDWVEEQYAQTAAGNVPHEVLGSAARTCSKVTAFLLGTASVQRDTLLRISPVMLAKLFQHLGSGMLPTQPCAQGMQAAVWARDVRAAILLLLIARCSLDNAALQQAGGEGVFVDLLSDMDPRVRFHASTFLQQRLRTARPEVYRRALRQLMTQAMSHDDEKMLKSSHLQLSAMLENRLVDFSV